MGYKMKKKGGKNLETNNMLAHLHYTKQVYLVVKDEKPFCHMLLLE